jgi:hypothetical protein
MQGKPRKVSTILAAAPVAKKLFSYHPKTYKYIRHYITKTVEIVPQKEIFVKICSSFC